MPYLNTCIISLIMVFNPFLIDFAKSDLSNWRIVNDGVMGGLSQGKVEETDNGFLFYGKVSLANNGGFTSYRSPNTDFDLGAYETVTVRYKAEGIEQALQLSVDERFYIPNYKVGLAISEEWVTKTFKLKEIKQFRLGEPTGVYLSKEALDKVIRLSFITNEKKEGDFKLWVDYVKFE